MKIVSSATFGLSYQELQNHRQQVKSFQERPQARESRVEGSSGQPIAKQAPPFGASLYDVYGLEQGFSSNPDSDESVKISQLAKLLHQAEQDREVRRNGSAELFEGFAFEENGTISKRVNRDYLDQVGPNLLAGEADFDSLFKETISEDGGTIMRRINAAYLDQITTVEEALYLYEKFHESVEGRMVISLAQDTSEILLKIHSLANKDRHKKVTDLVDSASALYDRHQDFKQALAEQHPSLAGINFEFGLEGDEFKVLNADFGSRSTLSREQIKLIEDLANSDDQASQRLLEVMYKIRETSVNFYNMWSERGRSDPIDSFDFNERFGGFNSYLESFHSAGSARGKAGPDDPTTYRDSYFSDATQYAVARLAR